MIPQCGIGSLGCQMWTEENRQRYDRDGLRYPSDPTVDERSLLKPLVPPARRGGRKRAVDMPEVANGGMDVLGAGCQRRGVPKDLPPGSTVHGYLKRREYDGARYGIHHALYKKCREQIGREAGPTACIIDS